MVGGSIYIWRGENEIKFPSLKGIQPKYYKKTKNLVKTIYLTQWFQECCKNLSYQSKNELLSIKDNYQPHGHRCLFLWRLKMQYPFEWVKLQKVQQESMRNAKIPDAWDCIHKTKKSVWVLSPLVFIFKAIALRQTGATSECGLQKTGSIWEKMHWYALLRNPRLWQVLV